MARIVVVEDDPLYRESLEALFEHWGSGRLAHVFGNAEEALASLDRSREVGEGIDLVLMDLELPGMSGIEATRRIKALDRPPRIVVLTVFEEPRQILEAICAGADGYLLKRTTPGDLLDHLKVVLDGGAPLTAGVARTVLDLLRDSGPGRRPAPVRSELVGLTDREREVLSGLVRGLAYKQIAHELSISLDTVRFHIRGVYQKLQVHNVAEAVGRAIRERLV